MSKTVVVFTATGDQGRSVVDSMLEGGWNIIGLTRDPESKSSQALAKKGVKLHKSDLSDPDSYKDALKDADAAFVNTDFWSIYGKNGQDGEAAKKEETKQAIAALTACNEAGVKHIVHSTLDGGLGIPHWDSKYDATKWALSQDLPITPLYLSFYISGLIKYKILKPTEGDQKKEADFVAGLPIPDDIPAPGVCVEQTGLWARAAFENPKEWIGKDMFAVSDNITVAEMAQILSDLSGKKVTTNHMKKEFFMSDTMRKNMGEEQWTNWRAFNNQDVKRDLKASKAIVKGAWDFKDWAKQNSEVKKLLGF